MNKLEAYYPGDKTRVWDKSNQLTFLNGFKRFGGQLFYLRSKTESNTGSEKNTVDP